MNEVSSQLRTIMDEVEVTPSDLNDIFVTAMEGGINYWAIIKDYVPDETKASIVDKEDDEAPHYHVTEDTIYNGLVKYLKSEAKKANHTPWPGLLIFLEQHDATDADCIVQLGLFGEIQYG